MTESPARGSLSGGRWYFVVTVASLGILAWVPFVHGAMRLHSRAIARLAAIYVVVTIGIGLALGLSPVDEHGDPVGPTGQALSVIGGLALVGVAAMACVQQMSLRRKVYGGETNVDPALAAALAARRRRAEARQLVAKDPLIAHELKVGRPDLPHSYDDGGLVDLNSAPAGTIAQVCELSMATAQAIVDGRAEGFLTVDDVLTMIDIPVGDWELIRDRGVVIPR